jgi:serine protease Do
VSTINLFSGGDGALDEEMAVVAEAIRRSTVQVTDGRTGGGTGVIWRDDGLIITNAHVARGADAKVTLWDGRQLDATVTSRDPRRDLAALAVRAVALPAPVTGDPASLRAGDIVLALGNPLGIVGALALGIVHVVDRQGSDGPRWIRADVRLAPGNSGGPLSDAQGRVVGINTLIANGLGVAIPVNRVTEFLGSAGQRPRLGIAYRPVRVPRLRSAALLVLEVAEASPAAAAGIWPGDVIVGVNDKPLSSPEELGSLLAQVGFGETVSIDVLRGGFVLTRKVTLHDVPAVDARAA